MLAKFPIMARTSRLDPEVHLKGTARSELMDFIASELPRWRDNPDRPPQSSETALTSQLCDHLNSAARTSIWRRVQFRTEVPDEVSPSRRIDLAPQPCDAVFFIEGRRHTQFQPLFPIECKRLPTPTGKDRDAREYVVTTNGATGGIQRFKFGHHGANHCFGGMIAYVQDDTLPAWFDQINQWIGQLAGEPNSQWSSEDCLRATGDHADTTAANATL